MRNAIRYRVSLPPFSLRHCEASRPHADQLQTARKPRGNVNLKSSESLGASSTEPRLSTKSRCAKMRIVMVGTPNKDRGKRIEPSLDPPAKPVHPKDVDGQRTAQRRERFRARNWGAWHHHRPVALQTFTPALKRAVGAIDCRAGSLVSAAHSCACPGRAARGSWRASRAPAES